MQSVISMSSIIHVHVQCNCMNVIHVYVQCNTCICTLCVIHTCSLELIAQAGQILVYLI